MKSRYDFAQPKSLCCLKLLNWRRTQMEKMDTLNLIAYAIVLVVGENLRAQLFPEGGRKNKLSCGSFIFLNLRPNLSPPLLSQALSAFSQLVLPVRSNVRISARCS